MLSKSHFLLAGLIATGTALAQVPPPPPAGAPVQPGAIPAAQQAGLKTPDPRSIKQEGYLEPKINGERLAEIYSELTGRRVTVSNAAITAEFRFVQQGPITYGEAAELLKVAAVMEGFVFIPSGENHDRLVYSQNVATPGGEHLRTVTDAADLPEGEEVVTYVMQLKHIKPDEVVRTFTAVVKQFGNFGSVAAVPNAACVLITEKSSLIRRLIELQDVIDVPKSDVGTKFIKVQYADVQELSEILNEILNTNNQQQSTAGVQRVQNGAPAPVVAPGGAVPAAVPGVTGGEGGGAGEDVPIQIVPSPRTNQIFAMGRPVDIVFVESLVAGFDTPTDTRNYLRRKLKFLAVADFLPVAEQALQRAFGGSNNQGGATGGTQGGGRSGANFGGGGGGNNSRTNQASSSRSSGSSRSGSSGSSNGFGSSQSGSGSNGFGGSGGGSGGGSAGGGASGDTLVNNAPTAQLVGRTLLVADNITNSLVVQGPPASLEVIGQLLDEIDVKAEQVMISCIFGQLQLNDDLNYGLDFLREVESRGDNKIGGRGGSGAGPTLPLDGSAFDPGDLAATAGLGLYGKIGPYLNLYLQALQATTKFNIVARPTVFMANNQTGRIRSGQQIAVPTNSFNSGTTGQSTNIDYRDVVLDLEVTPLVNSPDEVTLQISVLNDEVVGSQVIEGVGEVPTISTRELLTTVTVPNNETIVLGGLITTRNNQKRSGIPLLSQIPYIGGIFGSTTNETDREELLVFIQPKIINDKGTLYDGQADVDSRYKFDDENREFIDGPGVLPTKEALGKPATSGKAKNAAPVPVVEEQVQAPHRVSSRPKGFVKNR
ncbi:type II secretion system protein GspD [Luteolibacter soli]|uniref:Secretin N-terminal domain-containing protein n=1 Tax=Luteolibacter soli TaxID=3135280 RepID=A0ABU9ASB7_9BACT